MIGTVTGYEIGRNRNGTRDVLLLQVRLSEPDDVQTVEYMSATGDDSVPPTGSRVVVLSAGPAWKIAIAAQDEIKPVASEGERILYSQESGSIKAFIALRTDGNAEINGDAKTAVRFSDLDTALQNLVAAINVALGTKLDGGGTAGTLTLDLSAAEAATVKLP